MIDIEKVRSNQLTAQEAEQVAKELSRYRLREPSVEEDERGPGGEPRTVSTHPSYAVCSISRVSGNATLFDSKLKHQHYITMSISSARVHEGGFSRNVWDDGWELIEVAMSETQFARMITSMNMGSGTPCTLNHWAGQRVEEPPVEQSDRDDHKKRIKDMGAKSVESMRQVLDVLNEWIKDKRRPTLKELGDLSFKTRCSFENVGPNMAFTHDLLHEAMEERIGEAKAEIEAHVTAIVNQSGMRKLLQAESLDRTKFIEDHSND